MAQEIHNGHYWISSDFSIHPKSLLGCIFLTYEHLAILKVEFKFLHSNLPIYLLQYYYVDYVQHFLPAFTKTKINKFRFIDVKIPIFLTGDKSINISELNK